MTRPILVTRRHPIVTALCRPVLMRKRAPRSAAPIVRGLGRSLVSWSKAVRSGASDADGRRELVDEAALDPSEGSVDIGVRQRAVRGPQDHAHG